MAWSTWTNTEVRWASELSTDFTVLCHLNLDHLELEFFAVIFLGWTRRFGMKASKFTDAQKAFVVKQGEEGTPVAEIGRKAEIS